MDETNALTVHLSTETGLLAVMIPQGLLPRARDYSWWTNEAYLLAEANAGHVIPIETGSSGGYAVRVTFDDLDERAQRYAGQSAEFWLQVGDDQEVSVVAGEELAFPDTPGAATFWAPPGSYLATVTRIRWTEESDDDEGDVLPDYVVYLRSLDSDEEPPELTDLPDLSGER